MRIQHYLIIFAMIFLCMVLPTFFKTDILAKNEQVNTDYSNKLITATEGCMAYAAANAKTDLYFASEDTQKEAVDVFYETLIQSFNYENSTYKDLVKYYVPCIFLIDTNGYYVEYSAEFTNADGNAEFTETITPINKWAKSYSLGGNALLGETFQVEFRLNDTLRIVYQNPSHKTQVFDGAYSDAHDALRDAGGSIPADLLNMLSSYENFDKERRDVIINILNDQMEYYINVHDESLNQFNNVQYQFTLPQITGEQWARMIDQPTVVSFMQGMQTAYGTKFLNIYALAGSEVEYSKSYIIGTGPTDELYYHEPDCSYVTSPDDSSRYSMKEAAKNGAFPCPECIH